jgi:ketosteroid isomerase-like protein
VPSTRDELDIRRLLAEYCQLCDDGDFDALVDRFTEDCWFAFDEWRVEGHRGVRRWFETTQSPEKRGKHLTTNLVIELGDATATVVSDYLFLSGREGGYAVELTGRYEDELRREGGRWRFVSRPASQL